MGMRIDLNCDMGEGCSNDSELMDYITSANIACGYHAGDRDTMRRTIDSAMEKGVSIGAHPGYNDRANFGRTEMNLPAKQVYDLIIEQISTLSHIAAQAGTKLRHVKAHGALYNQAARDNELASAIAQAVRDLNADLTFFGLSGSGMLAIGKEMGLKTASEVFADRTYSTDGSLTPRTRPNALIRDTDAAIDQVMDMVKYGRVRSTESIMIPIVADTLCIHGDGEHALEFARAINERLTQNGVEIRSL